MAAQLPDELHRVKGTRATRAVSRESVFVGGKPKMPADLSPIAEAEWKRMVKELRKRGTLTRVDSSALETYCRNFALWRGLMAEAEAQPMVDEIVLDKDGNAHTNRIPNRALRHASQLGNLLARYQTAFAATPASRESAKPVAPKPKKDELVPGSMAYFEAHPELVTEE
jgi:P27 family predicted phage terminase small subunit